MEMLNSRSDLAQIPQWEDLQYSERFNEKWMDEQRYVGDDLADEVIDALNVRGFAIKDANEILEECKKLSGTEGGIYKDFLDACYEIPEWADFEKMKAGGKLFASHGPIWAISILAGGVIGSAFHVNAEPVFTQTGRFIVEDGVAARLTETGAILGLVPFIDEVRPGGAHHAVVMKVRILHACIRYWSSLKKGEEAYPYERCGTPINQEDMAFAMLIFSYLNVRGMLRLGAELSREQVDSLHLLWRYVAFVVGVSKEWDFETIEEQKEMYLAFVKHQAKPGVVSLAALSLLDGSVDGAPAWATRFLSGTLRSLTSYLGGTHFLQGLYLEERGNNLGLGMALATVKLWNLSLRFKKGEQLLYKFGIKGLKKRYQTQGGIADTHNYGVAIRTQEDIQASIKRQKERVSH